jgi:multidrug efflux pump subunit AcrB
VHIFGLLAGTVLTLFVLPVWYVVVVARPQAPRRALS